MENSSLNSSTTSKELDKKISKKVSSTHKKRKNVVKKNKKYDHVKSKVGQYIQQIKKQEAEHKRKRQLSIEMHNCLKNETKELLFLPLNVNKTSTNSSDLVESNNEILEKVNCQNSKPTIKCLVKQLKNMQEQFQKEQQKINQLQIEMAEVKNCIKLIFQNENRKNNLIENEISEHASNTQQKMINKLNLEPCECWNEPINEKIQTIIKTPTISSTDESCTLIQDSTKLSITETTSKFYSTDTTSYKRLRINFENTRGKQLKDKLLSDFNENHKMCGQKVREVLTKALCLSARLSNKTDYFIFNNPPLSHNCFLTLSNNRREEWTLNQAILYIEDIKNRITSLKLLLEKYSSLT